MLWSILQQCADLKRICRDCPRAKIRVELGISIPSCLYLAVDCEDVCHLPRNALRVTQDAANLLDTRTIIAKVAIKRQDTDYWIVEAFGQLVLVHIEVYFEPTRRRGHTPLQVAWCPLVLKGLVDGENSLTLLVQSLGYCSHICACGASNQHSFTVSEYALTTDYSEKIGHVCRRARPVLQHMKLRLSQDTICLCLAV